MSEIGKVLIVGGGIAGLVAASMLRDRGVAVDLVEKKRDWQEYGVGIIQQSNIMRAMQFAGLLDRYVSAGYAYEDNVFHDPEGVPVGRASGGRLAGPDFPANIGVRRSKLHEVLKEAALEKGTQVRLGVTVDALNQQPGRVDVTFSGGAQGAYDLVIGADGASSQVRALLYGDKYQPTFVGQCVWRHNFARPDEVDALQIFSDTAGNAAGLVPLAHDLMYMYLVTKEPGNPKMPQAELAELMRARMVHFKGRIGELRREIHDPAEVVYRPMEVVFVTDPWYQGRVVMIGDAVHTTTPHLAQGAGMAIEDAVVLSDQISRGGPLETVLSGYQARRYERAKYIQDNSLRVCRAQMENDHSLNYPQVMAEMLHFTAQPI
ncbi:FAD-dependent oxidoreductase [Deinococcus sp.]|uniref:FAD-dependent oxidoreductase n=1 Tax=Deinococcus sp. TaxID=47478 RepID=UPI0025EE89B3|nr:FAD-dependent oxidoreductase [Deinococcus sp.]